MSDTAERTKLNSLRFQADAEIFGEGGGLNFAHFQFRLPKRQRGYAMRVGKRLCVCGHKSWEHDVPMYDLTSRKTFRKCNGRGSKGDVCECENLKLEPLQVRGFSGQYDFADMEAMCVCGHKLGVHCAPNSTGIRDCLGPDGESDSACWCKSFKPAKERKRA